MTHDTAAPARQLQLVELGGDGERRGPTVQWPRDWPSAAGSIDLDAATLPQAVAAWRDWVTDADTRLLVDIPGTGTTEMVVLVGGRAFLARLTEPTTGTLVLLSDESGAADTNRAAESAERRRATTTAPSGSPVVGDLDDDPAPEVTGQRPAVDGDLCSCGRPAVTVYETERFGDVGYCGVPDGGAR